MFVENFSTTGITPVALSTLNLGDFFVHAMTVCQLTDGSGFATLPPGFAGCFSWPLSGPDIAPQAIAVDLTELIVPQQYGLIRLEPSSQGVCFVDPLGVPSGLRDVTPGTSEAAGATQSEEK
jgi:hypothetical protein